MTLNQLTRLGYKALRLSRDANAIGRAIRTGSPRPVVKRVERRALGRLAGRAIGRIVR